MIFWWLFFIILFNLLFTKCDMYSCMTIKSRWWWEDNDHFILDFLCSPHKSSWIISSLQRVVSRNNNISVQIYKQKLLWDIRIRIHFTNCNRLSAVVFAAFCAAFICVPSVGGWVDIWYFDIQAWLHSFLCCVTWCRKHNADFFLFLFFIIHIKRATCEHVYIT